MDGNTNKTVDIKRLLDMLARTGKKYDMEKISSALNATWILVLLAVFLPAAADGQFSAQAEHGAQWDPIRDFCILGVLAACVAVAGCVIHCYRKQKEKKDRKKKCVM